jgi:hypothetical protein
MPSLALRVVKTTKGKGAAASSPKWVVQKGSHSNHSRNVLQGGGFCNGTDQGPKGIQKALEGLERILLDLVAL